MIPLFVRCPFSKDDPLALGSIKGRLRDVSEEEE
jgi:hypothetical protein